MTKLRAQLAAAKELNATLTSEKQDQQKQIAIERAEHTTAMAELQEKMKRLHKSVRVELEEHGKVVTYTHIIHTQINTNTHINSRTHEHTRKYTRLGCTRS